jgi:serine phosphatase RsbU (regulator of sigma subunit)
VTSAAQEEVRLQELAALKVLDTPREERFDRIVRITQRLFDVPTVLVSLIDEDRQFHKAKVGFGPSEIPRSQSFCDHTMRDSVPFVVDDPEHHESFRDNPLVTGETAIRFYAGQPLHTRSGTAVGALCILDTKRRELSEKDLSTLRDLADLVEAELARTDELDRAVEVQRNLLPRSVPQLPGYEVDARCLPAAAVGGDFYDWFQVRDGFQLVTADVMGKGVPAAIIASSVRSLFRGASRFNLLDAALNRVADDIEDDLADTATFVTLFAARIDVTSHQLTYVDAGHGMGGIVSHDGVRTELTSEGLPLGAPRLSPYRSGTVAMEPGDTFVCVSDGLLDLFPSFAEAGEALRQTVLSSVSAKEVVERMVTYGRRHGATDDVTVVVLRRNDA